MAEIPTEVPGQLVLDLCEKLGVTPADTVRIEIEPRGIAIVHTIRRNESGQMVIGVDEICTQVTQIKIRWSK